MVEIMIGGGRRGISAVGGASVVVLVIFAALSIAYVNNSQSQDDQIASLRSVVNSVAASSASSTGHGGNWSQQACTSTSGSVSVTLVAETADVAVAAGVSYDAWTFNGTVPAPTIWVQQCELVHFTLINNDTMPHSIDFHAAEVNWATVYAPVLPGKSLSFDFAPAYPGVFMYHCGVPPVLEHIANGMYGVIVVNGTGALALPSAPGGQYVLTESEFYLNSSPGADGSYGGNYSEMLAATPNYVVFNGKAFQYVASPLIVKPDELVRLFVFNEGPNIWEAFHVIGAVMDTVYIDGDPTNVLHGLQTVNIPPAGGVIVDMYFKDAGGKNPFVNHAFAFAQKGATGLFQVENGTSGVTTTTSTAATIAGPVVTIPPGAAAMTSSTYYAPPTITVVIGVNNTVTWVNNDDAPHTVTASDGSFNSGNLDSGQSWTHEFTVPGTYAYFCSYHPWMKGTVIVRPSSG